MSIAASAWARKQKTGSATMKAVLIAVADYADEHGCAWPSQKRLAEDTELSARSVRDALAGLAEKGFLRREMRFRDDGSRASDRIFLACGGGEAAAGGGERASGGVGKDVPGGGERASPLTTFEPSLEPSKEQSLFPAASAPGPSAKSKAKKPNAKPDYHGDFEMLWAEFPKHPNSSKAEAYRSWLRLPAEDRDPAFDAARMFAAKVANEGQDIRFVPHLVTWLNQRRFDTILEAAE